MPTAIINITVPDLPDADVWFANNAAWANYWANINGEVTLDPAATTIYVPVAFDNTISPAFVNIDAVDYVLITGAMFQSLLNKVNTLDTGFQNMRSQLKDAGYIDNAQ